MATHNTARTQQHGRAGPHRTYPARAPRGTAVVVSDEAWIFDPQDDAWSLAGDTTPHEE